MARYRWRRYVPVAQRRAKAAREMGRLRKKGLEIEPVEIEGRAITTTFWGEAWCSHLEQFSDYANRLPRGRTYVRNGSVCHLAISKGNVQAIVSGSALYQVDIGITPLPAARWANVRQRCAGQIGSMLELLQGRLSGSVMEVVTHRSEGLFPQPEEIDLSCDCPDWAVMCKHVAAVLYGIGARLDRQPELLFLLRDVDREQLISTELDLGAATAGKGRRRRLVDQGLADVFGIDIEDKPGSNSGEQSPDPGAKHPPSRTKSVRKSIRQDAVGRNKAPATVDSDTSAGDELASAAGGANTAVVELTNASKEEVFTPSPATVARLRNHFQMNRSQFARLLGVTQQTVANWEKASGQLNLRRATKEALGLVVGLSKAQAWGILKESQAVSRTERARLRK